MFVAAPAPALRAGLRAMLEDAGARVVGEAGTVSASSGLSGADVVVVEDGALLEEVALSLAPDGEQALVLLSEDERSVAVLRDLPLRGWGVVPPDALPEELEAAIYAASQGLAVLPSGLAASALRIPEPVEELPEPPTAREREVLELLARGLSNKQISRELHISEHTVKFHISSLYAKLGVRSRAEAVSTGARRGLISL